MLSRHLQQVHKGVEMKHLPPSTWHQPGQKHYRMDAYAYYNAASHSVCAVSDIVTEREISRMAMRKHDQGLRRAARRSGTGNWLIPRHMDAVTALRIGQVRSQAMRSYAARNIYGPGISGIFHIREMVVVDVD